MTTAILLSVGRHVVLSHLIFLGCIIVQLGFWARLAWRLRPSISRVPGPSVGRWSRLWIAKALASGRSHEIWVEANAEYGISIVQLQGRTNTNRCSCHCLGPVARIGPNHVITDSPDVIRRILSVRSGYVRGPWFDSVRIDPHVPNIVSERDVKRHGQIRAKLAPSVSARSTSLRGAMLG